MEDNLFFDEEIVEMDSLQKAKQNKITTLLEDLYNKKSFDLPYLYNGFDDNLYCMNNSSYLKVDLLLDDINKDAILEIIDKLEVIKNGNTR